MTGSDEQPLGAWLEDLLRRQAERRGAPAWIRDLLAGQTTDATLEEEGDARIVATRAGVDRCEIEVRVIFATPPPSGRKLWRPGGVRLPTKGLGKLSYIVVDEIVGDDADVSVSAWPKVDNRGRLVFSDEPALGVRTNVKALTDYLSTVDFRPGRGPAPLRMGSALAAVVRTARLSGDDRSPVPPASWLVPPVYDISTPAREKAKEAFYAAVAPTLSPAEVEAIEQEAPDA